MVRVTPPKPFRVPQRPSRAALLAAVKEGAPVSITSPGGAPRRPAPTAFRPLAASSEQSGMGGVMGAIINVIDKPRAVIASTAKMGVDVLQGDASSPWDALRLALALPTGGLSLATSKDWRERVGDNYMMSELLVEDFGMDPQNWGTKALGFGLDVAADPLMYIPGAGAAGRAAGMGWMKVAKALDQKAVGFAMVGDLKKANALKESAVAVTRNRSILAAGREGLEELGFKAGASLVVPGTGRIGRHIVEKPLNLLTGGKLTKALAKKRAKQIPDFMFDRGKFDAARAAESSAATAQDQIVEVMGLLGRKHTRGQVGKFSKEIVAAARFARTMAVELPGSIKAFAGPMGYMAGRPGRLWGTMMRQKPFLSISKAISGTAGPLKALTRSSSPDDVIVGMRALDARDTAKVASNIFRSKSSRLSQVLKTSVVAQNAARVKRGLPEITPEQIMYMSDTPASAIDPDLLDFHEELTQFWRDKLDLYNADIGHRGDIEGLIDELYAARFLDLNTEIGRKIKGIEVEDVGGEWAFRGMSGDDPTRWRRWRKGETYMGILLEDPDVVGKSVRQQMLDIGREVIGPQYEDMFVKDFFEVVARYDKAMSDRFFHQKWFNELEQAGLLQVGWKGKGGYLNLSREQAERLDKMLSDLKEARRGDSVEYQSAQQKQRRAVDAARRANKTLTSKTQVLNDLNDDIIKATNTAVNFDEVIKQHPGYKQLTPTQRTELDDFIRRYITLDEISGKRPHPLIATPDLVPPLSNDARNVLMGIVRNQGEAVAKLRWVREQIAGLLEGEAKRAGRGVGIEEAEYIEYLDSHLHIIETHLRSVAGTIVDHAESSAEVAAFKELAAVTTGDAVAQGIEFRGLPEGFIPPVDLLGNYPRRGYFPEWSAGTQGFLQEADIVAFNPSTGEALIRTPDNAGLVGLEPDAVYRVDAYDHREAPFGHFEVPRSEPEFSGSFGNDLDQPYTFNLVEAKGSWRTLKNDVQTAAVDLERELSDYYHGVVGELVAPPPKMKWVYEPGRGKVQVRDTGQAWDWIENRPLDSPLMRAVSKEWFGGPNNLKMDEVADLLADAHVTGEDYVAQEVGDFLIESTIQLAGLRAISKGKGHVLGKKDSFGTIDAAVTRLAENLGVDEDLVRAVATGGVGDASTDDLIRIDRHVKGLGMDEHTRREIGQLVDDLVTGEQHVAEGSQVARGGRLPQSMSEIVLGPKAADPLAADTTFDDWFDAVEERVSRPESYEGSPSLSAAEADVELFDAIKREARGDTFDGGPGRVKIPVLLQKMIGDLLQTSADEVGEVIPPEILARMGIDDVQKFWDSFGPDGPPVGFWATDQALHLFHDLAYSLKDDGWIPGVNDPLEYVTPNMVRAWLSLPPESTEQARSLLAFHTGPVVATAGRISDEMRMAAQLNMESKGGSASSLEYLLQPWYAANNQLPLAGSMATAIEGLPSGTLARETELGAHLEILGSTLVADPGAAREYFSELQSVARAARELKLAEDITDDALRTLGSAAYGDMPLPSGIGAKAHPLTSKHWVQAEQSYDEVVEIADPLTGEVGPLNAGETGWELGSEATQPLQGARIPLSEMPAGTWADYRLDLEKQIREQLHDLELGTGGRPSQAWSDPRQVRYRLELYRVTDERWDELVAGLKEKYPLFGDELERWERELAESAPWGQPLVGDPPGSEMLGDISWPPERRKGLVDLGHGPIAVKEGKGNAKRKLWEIYPVKLKALLERLGYEVTATSPKGIMEEVFARPGSPVGFDVLFVGEEGSRKGSRLAAALQPFNAFNQKTSITRLRGPLLRALVGDFGAIIAEKEGLAAGVEAALKMEVSLARYGDEAQEIVDYLMTDPAFKMQWVELGYRTPLDRWKLDGVEGFNLSRGFDDSSLRNDPRWSGLLDEVEELIAFDTKLKADIRSEIWKTLPDPERVAGGNQYRQFWRDRGYQMSDEPQLKREGRGFPWQPPEGTRATGGALLGETPGRQALELPKDVGPRRPPVKNRWGYSPSRLGDDVDPKVVEKNVEEALPEGEEGLLGNPQHRTYAKNVAVLRALDEIVGSKFVLESPQSVTEEGWAAYKTSEFAMAESEDMLGAWRAEQTRLEAVRELEQRYEPFLASIRAAIKDAEIAEEIFPKRVPANKILGIPEQKNLTRSQLLASVDTPLSKEGRKVAGMGGGLEPKLLQKEIVAAAKARKEAATIGQFGLTPSHLAPTGMVTRERIALQNILDNITAQIENTKLQVEQAGEAAAKTKQVASELEGDYARGRTTGEVEDLWMMTMLKNQEAQQQISDLSLDLQRLAKSPNVVDQISAAATQEEAIRAVMSNRVLGTAFADMYGEATNNFLRTYQQMRPSLVPGGRGGGPGGPSYWMGGMSDDGWRLFEEAVQAGAGLADPKKLNQAFAIYLKVANWWKAQAVASPGFIMRNLMGGAMVNSLVAGVEMGTHSRVGAMAQMAHKRGSGDVVYGARLLANEGKTVRLQNLFGINRKATADDWGIFAELLESGVVGSGQAWSEVQSAVTDALMPLQRSHRYGFTEGLIAGSWKPWSADFKPFSAVRLQNERAEFVLRSALGFDIMKKGGNAEDAMRAINKYHFDYQDLTNIERGIKAVVPFYTWQKNIIPVLIESLGQKPQAWTGFLRAKAALELGEEDDRVVPDYYAELMGMALPWKTGGLGGGRIYAVPDTPFRQLFQFTKEPTSPVREVTGSLFPWVKTPIEIWSKKQFFADIPFSGRYQQVPTYMSKIPGLLNVLEGAGKAKKNRRGEWKMRDHDIYLVDQFSPILGRARRQFPNEKAKQRRYFTTWLSYLLGLGVRVNDSAERRNQMIKDQVGHSNDMRDKRDIEGRTL